MTIRLLRSRVEKVEETLFPKQRGVTLEELEQLMAKAEAEGTAAIWQLSQLALLYKPSPNRNAKG